MSTLHSSGFLPAQSSNTKPHALKHFDDIARILKGKTIGLFLDYDGTCTPIVSNPSEATINESMRSTINNVSLKYPTAIVTGRKIDTINAFVALSHLYYAGSHGFDIRAPQNQPIKQVAEEFLPALASVRDEVREAVQGVEGALVEDNVFSVSVHYRNVRVEDQALIHSATEKAALKHVGKLQMLPGKMVWEVRPLIDWHKGQAVQYLLSCMFPDTAVAQLAPICMGDDTTDEDAFRVLEGMDASVTVLVVPEGTERMTNAKYVCQQKEVQEFLDRLAKL